MIAHIRSDNGIEKEQTVKEHLDNVSKLCAEYAAKIGLANTGQLIGLTHDIGKLTEAFSAFLHKAVSNPKLKSNIDHSTAGAIYITEVGEEILAKQKLDNKEKTFFHFTIQLIAECVLSHHGGLRDIVDIEANSPYIERISKIDRNINNNEIWIKQYNEAINNFETIYDKEEIMRLLCKAKDEVTDFYVNKIVRGDKSNYGFEIGMLCKFLYSCLIDADRADTAAFAYNYEIQPQENYQWIWEKYNEVLNRRLCSMPIDTKINQLRRIISDNCVKAAQIPTGIYLINSPTGSGKNFAVLRFALEHAKQRHKSRIIFVIPLLAIIEQNVEAIRNILGMKAENVSDDRIILELHSAKLESEQEKKHEINESDIVTEDESATIINMKKQLTEERIDTPITFMTMVRFLNICFASGTKGIRALHNFTNSILIFDEIQTLPTNQIALFNAMVNFLSIHCNATVILSTATQPALAETPTGIPSLKTCFDNELSGCTTEMKHLFKRTRIDISKYSTSGNDVEATLEMIEDEIAVKQNLLFVVNSKSAADVLYLETVKRVRDIDVYKLTTDLCAENRTELISAMKSKLLQNEKVIVISTKLIEAGVDVSFQTVYRSLSGLDSLIQCAGRCNRNGEFPDGKLGVLYLVHLTYDEVSRMPGLLCEQEAMKKLLYRYQTDPAKYSNDLDSERAIQDYFKLYYQIQKDFMEYPIPKIGNYTMYKLLNDNKQMKQNYLHDSDGNNEDKLVFYQSFHTAASYYQVIEDYGTPVVVPYKEGGRVIEDLCSELSYTEKIKVLRKSQRYIVNVNFSKFHRLKEKEVIKYYPEIDTWILKEGYYSDIFGISEEFVGEQQYFF